MNDNANGNAAAAAGQEWPAPEPNGVSAQAPPKGRPWRRVARWAMVVGALAWTVGAVFAGIAIGTRQRLEPPAPPPDVVIEVEQLALPDQAPAAPPVDAVSLVTPNVLGLDVAAARLVIADNTPDAHVAVTEVPTAGASGHIIDQSPPPGTPEPATIELSVTAPTPVPDVVGLPRRDAQTAIEALGGRVRVVEQYVRDAALGTVLSIEPAEGDLPSEVTVTVAAAAASAYLTSLRPVSTACSVRDVNVNGEAFEDGIECQVGRAGSSARVIEYDLSRDVDQLTLNYGITDVSNPASVARVTVTIDGTVIHTGDIGFGAIAAHVFDVAGALRLTITVEGLSENADGRLAIVDALVLGSATAIAALTGQS